MNAVVTASDSSGRAIRAVVGTGATKIVCTRDVLGRWEPLHGLNPDGDAIDLPSCFELNGAAVRALDEAAETHDGGAVR